MIKTIFDLLVSLSPVIISIVGIYYAANQFRVERKSNNNYGKMDEVVSKLIDAKLFLEDMMENIGFYAEKFGEEGLSEDDKKHLIDDDKLKVLYQKLSELLIAVKKAVYNAPNLYIKDYDDVIDKIQKQILMIRLQKSCSDDLTSIGSLFLDLKHLLEKLDENLESKIEKYKKLRDET